MPHSTLPQVSILFFLLSTLHLLSLALQQPKPSFPAIFNFGDSNSDTGNFAAAFPPLVSPYGETTFGRPAGRFSDGRLVIDFLAQALGIPYLSPYFQVVGSDFRHGANFACAAATVLEPNASFSQSGLSPFSLVRQFRQFQALKNLSLESFSRGEYVGKLPRPDDFRKALYTIDIGQNDVAGRVAEYTTPQLEDYFTQIVAQIVETITGLYNEGARTFIVSNVGPIGCLPYLIAYVPHERKNLDENGCQVSYDEAAAIYNARLRQRLQDTRSKLSDASLIYLDSYGVKYELVANAYAHGFHYKTRVCCGVGGGELNLNSDIWCGRSGVDRNGSHVTARSCPDPSVYVSWDGAHTTEAANHYMTSVIVKGDYFHPRFVLKASE